MRKLSNRGLLIDGIKPSKHPLYGTWSDMHRRCYDVNNKLYPYYGGRGIFVCDRWFSFPNFVDDVGCKPNPSLTLDRVKNDGPYSDSNFRWATKSEQALNRGSRSDSPFGVNGVTQKGSKFVAAATIAGVVYPLGSHATLAAAIEVRKKFDDIVANDFSEAMLMVKSRELPATGARGVYNYRDGRFIARVYLNKCKHDLGIFDTIEEANNARQDYLAKQAA